jgi:hypothetical protein
MRKHSLTRFWVWCVGALIALVSTATIATTTVPLRATIGFTEQVGAPSFGCALTGTIDGFGTAGKLGALHLTSTDCINPLSATQFVFVSDEVVLDFGNGDQIFAAYGGTLSANTGAIHGSYFIYGGSGRFENARGIGTIEGFEGLDFETGKGSGQVQLKGTLTY